MARKRDVEGLTRYLETNRAFPLNPFSVLKTGGPYGTGRFGWRALSLESPSGGSRYVVFSTPLTAEDIGELLFEVKGAQLGYLRESETFGVRIRRHKFDLTVDDKARTVRITDQMHLSSDGKSGTYFFRLSPYFKVTDIEGAGKKIAFRQSGGIVALEKTKEKDFTLVVRYAGSPALPQYAGSFQPGELQLTNDYWYPMIGRLPTAFDLTVRSPKDWTVVAQGEREANTSPGVAKLKMDLPVSYLSLSAGQYRTFLEPKTNPKFEIWSREMPEQQMRWQTELFKPVLEWYSKKLDPYPFTTFGALMSKLYGGGALEAYSYATYGEDMLPSEETHEPAHTWFGGKINNTYLRSFWNESFAAFFEGLYAREADLGDIGERRNAFVSPGSPSPEYHLATCDFSPPEVGSPAVALGYGKGAQVLQMLEMEMGTERLLEAMRKWLAKHPAGEPGEWADFERHAIAVGGPHLKVFFDQWLRRKGWPKFTISAVQWENGKVTGEVRFEGERYRLVSEVLLLLPDRRREFKKVVLTPSFDALGVARFEIESRVKPMSISIDPWRRLLRDIARDEAPPSLEGFRGVKRFVDPKHPGYLSHLSVPRTPDLPSDLNGVVLVGHPDTVTGMRQLCAKAGFEVKGDKLTYKGTTIDLNEGAALALIDLAPGKQCMIGLGKTLLRPNIGNARTAVVDKFGRFLRGVTEPKTHGSLTYRIGGKAGPVLGSEP